jgi:hypothetical protein
MNNNQTINIPLNDVICVSNIKKAIASIFSVDDYIDWRFEKDINYRQKKQGVRDTNIKNKKMLENTILLEEDIVEEEQLEEEQLKAPANVKAVEDINIHEILKEMPDNPKPKNKSRKKQLKPNVKQTKRNLSPVNFIEVPENEI